MIPTAKEQRKIREGNKKSSPKERGAKLMSLVIRKLNKCIFVRVSTETVLLSDKSLDLFKR